ncbi:hypothetical protein ACKXGF_07420 [Alkalibacillus sp. S2W]|uniref:hypothetical protein n=1 Tax=Alkalibacillus sp. S2W TaxID=3386553 RepID=UPI00398C8F87
MCELLDRYFRKSSALVLEGLFSDMEVEEKQKFIIKILKLDNEGKRSDLVEAFLDKADMDTITMFFKTGNTKLLYNHSEELEGEKRNVYRDIKGSYKDQRLVCRIFKLYQKGNQMAIQISNQDGRKGKTGTVHPTGKNNNTMTFYLSFPEYARLIARAERYTLKRELQHSITKSEPYIEPQIFNQTEPHTNLKKEDNNVKRFSWAE